MLSEILDKLNPEQREAVEYFGGPLLIIAGAGSGKTRVITNKIAFAVHTQKFFPSEIFAATFTNKAAGEMRERVHGLLDIKGSSPFNIGTFHSLCARILRIHGYKIGISKSYTILDDNDQLSLIKQILKRAKDSSSGLKAKTSLTPSLIQWKISNAKINILLPADLEKKAENDDNRTIASIYTEYQKILDNNNSLDYDDLILKTILLFKNDPDTLKMYRQRFKFILVDEYQDTNYQQFELIHLLAEEHQMICVVGDEDQSIYSWRGADIKNIIDFQKKFNNVKLIKLEQNYRSTQNILSAANKVIKNNKSRIGKNLWTKDEGGSPLYLIRVDNETDEARYVAARIKRYHDLLGIPYSEMAVFCRTNALTRSPETQFQLEKIPHKVIGAIRFYERAEVKDILSYLRLIINPNNDIAFMRIINRPKRGMGEKAVANLESFAKEHSCSLFEALCHSYENNLLNRTQNISIENFLERYTNWKAAAETETPLKLVEKIIDDINYESFLKENFLPYEVESRIDNIQELKNAIAEFITAKSSGTIDEFLELITLVSSQDDLKSGEDAVPIMTIHCAKGLEFKIVFIIGLEEPLFPSAYSVMDTGSFEEERRLFYVGITRAKKKLYLTYANQRFYKGQRQYFSRSCFLNEIPHNLINADDSKEFLIKENKLNEIKNELDSGRDICSDSRDNFPIGVRIKHSDFGYGTIVGHKKVLSKTFLKIYFDKGFEKSLYDISRITKLGS